MSKKTKRLEKDNLALTRKSELANRNIIEMAEERTRQQRDLETFKKKNVKLESLCRALQVERTALENKLRSTQEQYSENEEEEGSEEEEEGSYIGSDEDDDEDTEDEGAYEEGEEEEEEEQVNGEQCSPIGHRIPLQAPEHVHPAPTQGIQNQK